MNCKYHPSAQNAGICALCKSSFCEECAIEIRGKEKQWVCLDCGVTFVKRKLRNSIIAAVLGMVAAIMMVSGNALPGWNQLLAVLFYGYMFWAVY